MPNPQRQVGTEATLRSLHRNRGRPAVLFSAWQRAARRSKPSRTGKLIIVNARPENRKVCGRRARQSSVASFGLCPVEGSWRSPAMQSTFTVRSLAPRCFPCHSRRVPVKASLSSSGTSQWQLAAGLMGFATAALLALFSSTIDDLQAPLRQIRRPNGRLQVRQVRLAAFAPTLAAFTPRAVSRQPPRENIKGNVGTILQRERHESIGAPAIAEIASEADEHIGVRQQRPKFHFP